MTAFIFDLDGTLADTVPYIYQNIHQTLKELDISVSDEKIRAFIGIPLSVTGERFLGEDRKEEYINRYVKNCQETKFDFKAFSGLKEMLESLQKKGAKLAVATSKLEKPALSTLETIELLPYFSVIIHSEMDCGFKPNPGPGLRAMAELESEPHESWFIGDSIHDITCAQGAGMHAIGVTWGATNKEQFAILNPDFICDSVSELSELLHKILSNELNSLSII